VLSKTNEKVHQLANISMEPQSVLYERKGLFKHKFKLILFFKD